MNLCEHYACRCAKANELAVMAERAGRNDMLFEATQVHDQKVPCRQQPKPASPGDE